MSDERDVGPELRQLAKTLLGLIDPLVQAGATAFASTAEGGAPGKCTQVWCPLCAAAAVAAGESHPLASTIAHHGATLLDQLRAAARADPAPPSGRTVVDETDPSSHGPGRYQPIPVIVSDE